MEPNHGSELRKFEVKWKKLRKEYLEAGMKEEAIEEMYRFDWEVEMRQQRTFYRHNLLIGDFDRDEEDGDEPTARKLGIEKHTESGEDPEEWIFSDWREEIENEALYKALQSLSESDAEIVTLYAIEGFSLTEIAKKYHVSQQAISKKMKRIKNFLKLSQKGL